MTSTDLLNAAGIALALALAAAASLVGGQDARLVQFAQVNASDEMHLTVNRGTTVDGRPAIESSDGVMVPVGDYQRIMVASSMAADALLEVASPDRIVAIPTLLSQSTFAFRYGDAETIDQLSDVEAVLSLRPDLVVFNRITESDVATRLRERGVEVFDLGSPTGANAWAHDVVTLGALLGQEQRGRDAAGGYLARLAAVAVEAPSTDRDTALVLASYGEQFFGGADGTSYHDVIEFAGLRDAAVGFQGWPQYDPEDIVQLNPDWIVTTTGMERAICSHPVIKQLTACADNAKQVVGVPEAIFGDAGLRILDSAEFVHRRIGGE